MRAAYYRSTGSPDVLKVGDLAIEPPGEGEVQVAVRASGINPADTKRRAGWRGAKMAHPLIVPHADGAGVIVAVGEGVSEARIASRVYLYNAGRNNGLGTCAERVNVSADQAVPLPEGVSFDVGACLGIPAHTAHHAVLAEGKVAGLDVLVQGGAGAVGLLAVQIASHFGARVIATVSHDEGAKRAREAGAADVIDRHREDVVQAVHHLTDGAGVQRIVEVDLGANLAADVAMIAENGTISSYSSTSLPEPTLPYYALAQKGVTVRFVQAYILPERARAAAISDVDAMLRAGTLQPGPATTFDLANAAAAHAHSEAGAGKAIITI
ncbi:MAG: NADPH:quinone reductase [Pseudomonadota bacterium]